MTDPTYPTAGPYGKAPPGLAVTGDKYEQSQHSPRGRSGRRGAQVQDMTQGPDQIHAALRTAIEVETHAYLWTPSDGIDFVPALASKVFGDGRALLRLMMINYRPRYHVIRIDSTWVVGDDPNAPARPELWDFIDEIYDALEEQFGPMRDEESDEDRPWPAFDSDGGCSWSRMHWPELPGVKLTPHPFAPHYEIAEITT